MRSAAPALINRSAIQTTISYVGIGMSIFLIAAGAVLRYAVTVTISGVELQTVGLILMIAGIVGLVISLAVMFAGDRRRPDEPPTRRYD